MSICGVVVALSLLAPSFASICYFVVGDACVGSDFVDGNFVRSKRG